MTQHALSQTETAYVRLVLERYQAKVRIAEQEQQAALQVVLNDKGVPDGAKVDFALGENPPVIRYTP